MSTNMNNHLFTATGTASAALNVLGTLVHRFPDEGEYLVTATREDVLVGETIVVVDEAYHSRQVTLDVSELDDSVEASSGNRSCEAEDVHCIRPDGYGVFHVASGPGEYRVSIESFEERDVHELDSTELSEYDRFAATLMRPGTYTMRNKTQNVSGTIEVAYPDVDAGPGIPEDAVEVTSTAAGFEPATVEVEPTQGIIFDIRDPSHIQIELEEPHERATEDPGRPTQNHPDGPDRSDKVRPDPNELTLEDLVTELSAINRPTQLHAMLTAERTDKNRDEAIRHIKQRLQEVTDQQS